MATKQELETINKKLLKSLKETITCLKNWVEIADDDDMRQYDVDAIKNADKVISVAEALK